jgi:hypothetical protein
MLDVRALKDYISYYNMGMKVRGGGRRSKGKDKVTES